MLNEFEITGRARTHLVQLDSPRFAAHSDVARAFLAMRTAAARDGIDLVPYSSFRDFNTQLKIWNDKFSGKKPLLDRHGRVFDVSELTEEARIESILNWSALPGASRHHWGTEIDVIDGAAIVLGAAPQLLPAEFQRGGPFYLLGQWLDANMAQFGFFLPYQYDQGGVCPEPWHLSYAPLSTKIIGGLSVALLSEVLEASGILGKRNVLKQLPFIFKQYVLNITTP